MSDCKATPATYTISVRCHNCASIQRIGIPRGRLVAKHPCPVCGCDALHPVSTPVYGDTLHPVKEGRALFHQPRP